MIAQASGFGMQVGRFSSPQRGVRLLVMPDAGLDTTRRVESVCNGSAGSGCVTTACTGRGGGSNY